MRNLVAMLWSEWKDLELQIMQMNDEADGLLRAMEACRRDCRQIPGIGPLVATAIVASIGNGAAFRKGRGVRGLVGATTEPAFNRWQGEAVWNQQAW